jgi:hypothetical protein
MNRRSPKSIGSFATVYSRTAAEEAVRERLARIQRSRLARECSKLDKAEEQALADEGYAGESEWPEY